MAASVPVNVFGEPITDATVRKYFPDKKEITRKDRAYFAYNLKEADKKYDKSQEYVLQQSKEWHGQDAATLITIYNATGDTLTYYTHHDFHGHIETPHKYTQEIQNGQWAAFLHVGSHAAVVYSGRNNNGQEIAWLHSWYNEASDNRKFVFTEIQGPEHYDSGKVWKYVASSMKNTSYHNTAIGSYTTASFSQEYPYKYSGIMTLDSVL
nr:23 kDa jasmonate-induced protein-like [Ziziphus jujuba var. spinosa]